jgi:two-component system, NarL family, sensor kinase
VGPGTNDGGLERYLASWRDSLDGLFTVRVEPEGRFVFESLNPALEFRAGLHNARFAGRTPEEVLSPPVAEMVLTRLRQCIALGRPISYAAVLDFPSGPKQWETSLAPLRDATGEIQVILGSVSDVSERADPPQSRAAGAPNLRAVIERVPDILYTAVPSALPDYVSPQFFDYTGLDRNAPVEAWVEFVNPEDLQRAMVVMASSEERLEEEVRLCGRDGQFRWFLVRADLVETRFGKRWFGVATDIHAVKSAAQQISELNDQLTEVLDSISDCYCTMDGAWRLRTANKNAALWFGRPEEELIGADVRDWFLKGDLRLELVERAIALGEPFRVEWMSVTRVQRWVELHGYPSGDGYGIFFRDVTERRAAQQEVEEARRFLQGSLDAMSAEIALIDHDGVIVAVNEAWRRSIAKMGRQFPRHGVGTTYAEVCAAVSPAFDEMAIARGLRELTAGRIRRYSRAFALNGDESEALRWIQLRITQFEHGGGTYFVATHEDVTEVARAQTALREISGQLLSVQEDERHRIAVELHDSTSQHLVALGLGVARLRRTMDGGADPVLDDMAFSLDEAVKEIRVLSYLMNPPNLERDGLAVAARNFVDGFGRRTGLHTSFRLEGAVDKLSSDIQRTTFRVIQEALANVHRHAEAEGVEVELTRANSRLSLRVADDGCGIAEINTPSHPGAQLGVGIAGMRARVEQLGGALSIRSDGAGTVLIASIPLSAKLATPPSRTRRRPSLRPAAPIAAPLAALPVKPLRPDILQ